MCCMRVSNLGRGHLDNFLKRQIHCSTHKSSRHLFPLVSFSPFSLDSTLVNTTVLIPPWSQSTFVALAITHPAPFLDSRIIPGVVPHPIAVGADSHL